MNSIIDNMKNIPCSICGISQPIDGWYVIKDKESPHYGIHLICDPKYTHYKDLPIFNKKK